MPQATLPTLKRSLALLSNAATEEDFELGLFGLAKEYASSYLQLDFELEVRPFLAEPQWWLADYGVSMRGGVAVGMALRDAFKCLVDVRRTFLLAQGIRETVTQLKQAKPRLTALEPGTGTGILAILLALYGVEQVIAIEYNSEIFVATEDFIRKCGLADRIVVLEGDATAIELSELGVRNVNLLVSENLSTGLMDEPQYEMIAHLSQYLADDAEILPCLARLSVALGDAEWGYTERQNIGQDMLPRCDYVSENACYADVPSIKHMEIPGISAHVTVPVVAQHHARSINTLILQVDFQINRLGEQIWIRSGDSQFVGRPWAFRLAGEVRGKVIDIELAYQAGRKMELIEVNGTGAAVRLSDPLIMVRETRATPSRPSPSFTPGHKLLKNRDIDWDRFDPYAYKEPNYAQILLPDRQIIANLAAFYRRHQPRGRILEVGPGSNLYPIFAALPFAEEIVCIEKGASNVAYLERQLAALDDDWLQWIELLRQLDADPARPYSIDFQQQLKQKVRIRQGDIFNLPKGAYDGGSMHHVAESLTQDMREFYTATRNFVMALKPGCPFAASFMKGSTGYDSPGRLFPAVPITEEHVMHALKPLSNKIQIGLVGAIRKEHAGIITAFGQLH
jgi:predicted RNA methylase